MFSSLVLLSVVPAGSLEDCEKIRSDGHLAAKYSLQSSRSRFSFSVLEIRELQKIVKKTQNRLEMKMSGGSIIVSATVRSEGLCSNMVAARWNDEAEKSGAVPSNSGLLLVRNQVEQHFRQGS